MTHQTVDATIEPVQDPSKRYRCRHIFHDGHRCGSPSLRGEHLCYYHHTTRGFAEEKRLRREWAEFELPPLEDRSSVLAAVTEVLQRIACDKLPAKQAGLLLYGLQIASNNLPQPDEAKAKSDNQPPVERVMINPRYGDLAPVEEIVEPQDAPRPALEETDEAPLATPEPAILPNLNASTDIVSPSFLPPTLTPVILSEASRSLNARGAVEGPEVSCPPLLATNSLLSNPEINTQTHAPGGPTWYPNTCHAYEKRTSRPPHSAHRHQAAQRRRSRRRHALHGLQLP